MNRKKIEKLIYNKKKFKKKIKIWFKITLYKIDFFQ
jgi:hypothetical protein